MATNATKAKEFHHKPGAYICIVEDGFAYFNKRSYEYGDRIIVDSEEMADKLMGAGERFVPEDEFQKSDGKIVRKVISASRNNKSIEDIVRSTEAEKAKMKAYYEAKIAELTAQIESSKK